VSRTKYCEILWCFANDEGRPLGTSVQAKVPNHLYAALSKRHGSER
jgi:hypothetical protein